jgi:hypothetical protein
MTKKKSSENLDKRAKKFVGWDTAIEAAEEMLKHTTDKLKRMRLESAIQWFKDMLEVGEPWPGERRKRNKKKSDR